MNVADLDTPALLIDLDVVESNIEEMATRCASAHVKLRPHTKTHKMPDIARLQLRGGAQGITCAKVGEAEVMVDAGFDDILIAFPVLGRAKVARLAALRKRARVLVAVDSVVVARGLRELGSSSDPLEVYAEVDTGLARTGAAPGEAAVELVTRLADLEGIVVVGLMSHAGHAYGPETAEELAEVVDRQVGDLVRTRELCSRAGVHVPEVSVGSTPSVRLEIEAPGVTEVRPGTYVFNDTTMIRLGAATERSCAAHVLTTVVSRPTPERFVVDAGSKCLSTDGIGRPGWIRVAGREDLQMSFLNEEHGVGSVSLEGGRNLVVGDQLRLIPSHVCTAVNLFDSAYAVRGDEVVGDLEVAGRGKVR
jgi:D-serine deaminase-like pyridoxal phosphate-dependent protein